VGLSKQIRGAILPFRRWLGDRTHTVHIDTAVDMVELLLDLKVNYLDPDPFAWPRGEIERLLLSVVPRRVIDGDPSDGSTAASLGTYLEFLYESKRFGGESAPYHTLLLELAAAAEEYPDLMGRPVAGPMIDSVRDVREIRDAGSVLRELELDDGDFEDPDDADVDELDEVNAEIVSQIIGGAAELPLVRLASDADLAKDARMAPVFGSLRALVKAIGPGRKVTKTEVLTLADAKAVIAEVGLGDVPDFKSARDVEELDRLWTIALEAQLLELRGQRVVPGVLADSLDNLDNLAGLEDLELVEVWQTVADTALGWWANRLWPPQLALALHWMLLHAYTTRQPVAYADAIRRVEHHEGPRWAERNGPRSAEIVRAQDRAYLTILRTAGQHLAHVGYVQLHGDALRLTRLGDLAVSWTLEFLGLDPPTMGPAEEIAAEDLVHAWPTLPEDDAPALLEEWVGTRGAASAVAALLDEAASAPVPTHRALALMIAEQVGSDGVVDAYQRALDVPALRPYAHNWLFRHGHADQPYARPEDRAYMIIDELAGMIGLVGEHGAAEGLAEMVDTAEQLSFLTNVWQCDHPDLVTVLSAIGDLHDDAAVRKAAKKSLFKARTRSVNA
jgi:hypothetical protein